MRILTSRHYIATFTVPPQTQHTIERARFVNLGRIWEPALAVAAYSPTHLFDLAHFINQIPVMIGKPWVITFESALPRMFPPDDRLRQYLWRQLDSPGCLAVVAMSAWALATFKRVNAEWVGLERVLAKTKVLQPAAPLYTPAPRTLNRGEAMQIVFVGNNFARKGGIVALRLAKKALKDGLPLHIHIVSSKMTYFGSHTDHPDPARYQDDLKNLGLSNITFHGAMKNMQVLDLMSKCHLNLLATLHDTYGFSVLEGFASGLPALTSDVCALPEFVIPATSPRANGFLLRLPKDDRNCWQFEAQSHSREYWDMLDQSFTSMADQAFDALRALHEEPGRLEHLSRGAIATVQERHNRAVLARKLDLIYSQANEC